MIWSVSWVAVRRVHADELWRTLGLRPTGKSCDGPGGTFSGATTGGWEVVCTRGDDRLADGLLLASLSALGETVGCLVAQHAHLSQAACWRNGAPAWGVSHEATRGPAHLQTFGELPAAFHDLERQAVEARRVDRPGPDVAFDVPIALAKAVVGFRHDEGNGRVFQALEPIAVAGETSAVVTLGSPADLALSGRLTRWPRSR